jgi:ribose-phosphate pyrophosphokinase
MEALLSQVQKDRLFLASGETHPDLSARIAENMGVELGKVELRTHPNTEQYVRYEDSVRGKHVVIIQPHAPANGRSVNDSLHQHLEMINAAKLASASHITALAINLAGARQDRKTKGREGVSVALNLRMLEVAGASRLVTVDLHSPQSLSAFSGQYDHLTAQPLLRKALGEQIEGDKERYVVVSPDSGRSKLSERTAQELGVDIMYLAKTRDRDNSSLVKHQSRVPNVDGRTCFMIDDMIDTAGTIQSAAETLYNSGAERIVTAATHGWFSDPAIERLQASPIDQIIITDTLPIDIARHELGDRLTVVSVAGMVANALGEIITEGSVSRIFDGLNYI